MRNFLEQLALKGAAHHLLDPPLDTAYARTRRLARVGPLVLRREWGWALRNLELVYGPELTPAARRHLASVAFEQHFYSYMEGARLSEIDVAVEGVEHLQAAMARGAGAIGVGVHLGSWEASAAAAVGLGVETSIVFRPLDSAPLKELSAAKREAGVEWIPKADVWSIRRALARGRCVLFAVDMNMTSGGIEVPFLGMPAMSPSGPARLALRAGAPLVPIVPLRTGPGHVTVSYLPALDPAGSAAASDPVKDLTRRVHEALEPGILENPEQYNWLHPRWRTRANGPAWTLADPIESMWAERVAPFPQLPEHVKRLLGAPA